MEGLPTANYHRVFFMHFYLPLHTSKQMFHAFCAFTESRFFFLAFLACAELWAEAFMHSVRLISLFFNLFLRVIFLSTSMSFASMVRKLLRLFHCCEAPGANLLCISICLRHMWRHLLCIFSCVEVWGTSFYAFFVGAEPLGSSSVYAFVAVD